MSKVTIVGGGLVGSLLAVFLAKRGHNVSVYERRGDPRKTDVYAGRSINLVVSHRGWTALRAAGVEEAVKSITVPVYARMTHDRDGKLNRVPYSIDNRAIYSVSRGELNRRLLSEAEKLPNVKLFFDHKCVDVDLENATCRFHTNATLSPPKGNEVVEVKADVVFGSDGAFSAVRQKMMQGRFTYSQEYIEHDYKEVAFPANADGTPKMDPQCLHIWPRRYFMMMGLANQDGGFTGTLFMPNTHTENAPGFDVVKTEEQAKSFFSEHFADAMPIVPDLVQQYLRNPQSSLVIIRCNPWTVNGKVALIGDAAHAIVPFYGEGMNAGYEDCKVMNDLLNEHGDDNWPAVLAAYGKARKPNGDAIADLSLRNFIEMRDLVADPKFLLRKKIEGHLQAKHPDQWLPLYSQVKFSDIQYKDAWKEGLRHDAIMEQVLNYPDVEAKWDTVEVEDYALKVIARKSSSVPTVRLQDSAPATKYVRSYFISYASEQSAKDAGTLVANFRKFGEIVYYDKDVTFRQSFKLFMDNAAFADYFVPIVTEGYLKSEHCMYEFLKIFDKDDYRKKILPMLDHALKLKDRSVHVFYVEHWQGKVKELQEDLKKIHISNVDALNEDLAKFTMIRDRMASVLKYLMDVKRLSTFTKKVDVRVCRDIHKLASSDDYEMFVRIEELRAGKQAEAVKAATLERWLHNDGSDKQLLVALAAHHTQAGAYEMSYEVLRRVTAAYPLFSVGWRELLKLVFQNIDKGLCGMSVSEAKTRALQICYDAMDSLRDKEGVQDMIDEVLLNCLSNSPG